MVSEYRALRASVVKQWTASNQVLPATDLEDLTRFNEAIDQAMTESVAEYTKMVNQSRDLFLGVLGHDLRNPIGAVLMTARSMAKRGAADSKQTMLAGQIAVTMERATSILDDLLELTRSAFGSDIPHRSNAHEHGRTRRSTRRRDACAFEGKTDRDQHYRRHAGRVGQA